MSGEGPGTVVGRYKLLQEVGEGGFGVVWQAEQLEPVRRTVALKILKPGMDTRQVVARFEAERQALALMDHPNIAKVLDAGATETGRPYFVMELVRGIPITEYCDQVRLDTAARLALFQQVCHGVQHAHQKGIVHRDLKPSNVLVALHDGVPVPKVIDFGVAKATDRTLTDKTLFTEFRQMIGTPEYMAPEQAEISGLDVDTRADVYSLGVLLYELLTGTKPHDLESLADKGYVEMIRTIREVDPQKPSTRVSTLGAVGVAMASRRHAAPKSLGKELRGDLDWIVMKALEKDRSRRYDTADAMALDVQRHLEHRPVLAGRPGLAYRARKYVRRHRIGATAAAAAVVLLVAGVVLSFAGYAEAAERRSRARTSREAAVRDRADAERARAAEAEQRSLAVRREKAAEADATTARTVLDLVQGMLGSADPHETRGPDYTVRELLDDFDRFLGTRLDDQPRVAAAVRSTIGQAYVGLGLADKARPHVDAAVEAGRKVYGEESPEFAELLVGRAQLHHDLGDYAAAEGDAQRAAGIFRKSTDAARALSAGQALAYLSDYRAHLGRYDDAERDAREAVAMLRNAAGDEHPAVAQALFGLARALEQKGAYEEAERVAREVLSMRRKARPGPSAGVASTLHLLANLRYEQGSIPEAVEIGREAVAMKVAVLGAEHPTTALGKTVLAVFLNADGKVEEAEALVRDALAVDRRLLGDGHPSTGGDLRVLSAVLRAARKLDEAESTAREAVAVARRSSGDRSRTVATSLLALGDVLFARRAFPEAERVQREALEIQRRALGDDSPVAIRILDDVARSVAAQGRLDEAEAISRDALSRQRRVSGGRDSATATLLRNLARILFEKRLPADAARLLEEALRIDRDARLPGRVLEDLDALLVVQFGAEEWAAAERTAREILAQRRHHVWLAMLGVSLLKQGRPAEAEPVLRETLDLRVKELPDHWWRRSAESLLGEALSAQGKYAEAEPLLLSGYERMEPLPENLARKREALERVVRLYEAWGKPDKAAEWKAKLEAGKPPAK
jgi:tetratricopeptide (TPR) repeat protein